MRIRLYAHGVDNFDSVGPARISPARIEIPEERRTQAHRISITNMSDSHLLPKIVSDHPGVIEIELPGTPIKPGDNGIIHIRASDELTARRIKTSFTLEMNDSENTRYTIPVVIGSLPDRNRHAGTDRKGTTGGG